MFKKLLYTYFKNASCNDTNYVFKRLAGHSKWANIKHTKTLKDGQKSKTFSKMSQQMKAAIQEGGSANPAHNLRLEQLVAQARRMSMPVATIENVIKSTQKKDKTQSKSHIFEIRGPGSCIILCEVFSPNLVKTKNDISNIMKKHFCKYTDGGQHVFDHRGIIETEVPPESGKSNEVVLELATNHAIECEAEDVKLLEASNRLQFFCDAYSFGKVQKNLEKLDYNITNASLEYIPVVTVSLSDSDLEICGNFFDKLESMDEVVKLYDNID